MKYIALKLLIWDFGLGNIHIKVNRNSIPYNNKINTMFSNNKLQLNEPNYCGIEKKVNKCKKEEL